jgi:GntR family transcriptional regulator
LARLVQRGLLERRQGSGTFLVRPPAGGRLQSGLEKLESYTVHAARLGLKLDSRNLSIEAVAAEPNEAAALEMPEKDPLVGGKLRLKEPSAALLLTQTMYLTDGRPVQWSRDTFLPGNLNLRVVRELFEVRRLT